MSHMKKHRSKNNRNNSGVDVKPDMSSSEENWRPGEVGDVENDDAMDSESDVNPYPCCFPGCKLSFLGKTEYRDHFNSHSDDWEDDQDYECQTCGKLFMSEEFLQKHCRNQKHGIHTDMYTCTECGKEFTNKHSLTKHMILHTGEKSYECAVCHKCFALKEYLKTHMRMHIGDKQFTCDQCEKSFASNMNLQAHMKIHSGKYPLVCTQCDKRFTLADEPKFRKHLILHSKPKPFHCMECDKAFDENYKLRVHLRVHTGEKPFACLYCDKSYQTKQNLNNHQKTHSGQEIGRKHETWYADSGEPKPDSHQQAG